MLDAPPLCCTSPAVQWRQCRTGSVAASSRDAASKELQSKVQAGVHRSGTRCRHGLRIAICCRLCPAGRTLPTKMQGGRGRAVVVGRAAGLGRAEVDLGARCGELEDGNGGQAGGRASSRVASCVEPARAPCVASAGELAGGDRGLDGRGVSLRRASRRDTADLDPWPRRGACVR